MENQLLTAVSDIYKLTVADLHKITPVRTEYNGRYWAFFVTEEVKKILDDYEAGRLKVVARDFVSSINRVKDRIFEIERARTRSGVRNEASFR